MEVINVHKKTDIGPTFSPFHYQKILAELYPKVNPILLRYATDKIGKTYAKLKEFDTNTDDNTIIRNIIKQKDVYAEFSNEFNKNSNIIQSDVIILGKKHNWSKFSDVVVTKFNNFKYNYPREVLDDHKKLLSYQYTAYLISELLSRLRVTPELPTFTRNDPKMIVYVDDIITNPGKFSGVSDFCQNMYHCTINIKNFYELYIQLRSIGMLEVLYKNPKLISKVIQGRVQYEILNFGRMKTEKESIDAMSAFNLLQKILIQEYDSTSEVFLKFRNGSVRSVEQFYASIPKKDAEKIKKIIGDRLVEVYQTPCVHTDIVRRFLGGKKFLREQVIELCDIDKNTMQYHCSKCSRRTFCQHHLDSEMKKLEFITKYKNPEISTRIMYYCKYCGEKIYKNETEYVLNSADFASMAKVRENSLARETNIDMFDNGVYQGINSAIQCFKIDYDYNPQTLIKTIQRAIYGPTHEQITMLSIENDSQYELITKMYSFIFALVYMRPLFMKDSKVTTKARTPKKDNAYGQFIYSESGSRFGELVNTDKVVNIIKIAAVKLKASGASDVKVQSKTEKDNISEIVQTKKFGVLYRYYNYGNPGTDTLTVFSRLIKKSKPTISTFDEGLIIPTKNVNENDKNIYTRLFDRSSPYCYINRLVTNEIIAASNNPKFDPKLYDSLMDDFRKTMRKRKVRSYRDVLDSTKDSPFGIAYGPNFMYDDEGNIITWKPMGWGKDWEYTSPSGKNYKLSKITKAIDQTTKAKIDARNETIGFAKANFVVRKATGKPEVPPTSTPGKYEFNKKLVGAITNLDSKFTHYMVEYLGRTESHEYHNLVKGLVKDVSSYITGSYRINTYIQVLLEKYYSLRNNPLSPSNSAFFENNSIDFVKSQDDIKKLPLIDFRDYFDDYKKRVSTWDSKNFYYWNLEMLLGFCETIIKSGSIGKSFCVGFFEVIFAEDKRRSMPDERKIMLNTIDNKLDEGEYDESRDHTKKISALQKIDYEEDEDDIND